MKRTDQGYIFAQDSLAFARPNAQLIPMDKTMFAHFPTFALRAIAGFSLTTLMGMSLGSSITLPAQAQSRSIGPVANQFSANQSSVTHRSSAANPKVGRVKFIPPKLKFNRGAPGNRGHNASRDAYCMSDEGSDSARLVTLVPTYHHQETRSSGKVIETEYVASLSHSPKPALWAYVPVDPTAEAAMLEFVLQNEAGEEIYQTEIEVPAKSGLLRIAPDEMPELAANQSYQWFLLYSIICVSGREPEIDYDEGTIYYQPATPSTAPKATPSSDEFQWNRQLKLAAEAAEVGDWHEALDQVALLRQAQNASPDERVEVEETWRSLLTDIGLESLINAPFVSD